MEKHEGKIAICITTRNRPDAFRKTESEIYMHLPTDATVFVVDDASAPRYSYGSYFTFTERAGIPRAKNKCLELAMESGAEHIFLLDDDCHPISRDWHLPYINSPYPHLCRTFLPAFRTENGHSFHNLGNGCAMYIHRSVIETIGGFDTRFGIGKYEHVQFSHRAHAAGLIPHPFIDVEGSDKLIYCMDERQEVQRTLTPEEDAQLRNEGRQHYYDTRNSTEFIPYL